MWNRRPDTEHRAAAAFLAVRRAIAVSRRKAARLATRIALGPVAGQLPHSCLESVEKYWYMPSIRQHILQREVLLEPAVVRLSTDGERPPYFRSSASYGPRHLYLLSNAWVSPVSGMVWFDGRIMQQSVGGLDRLMGWGAVLHEPLMAGARVEIEAPVIACPSSGYYHWLHEVMPNLLRVMGRFADLTVLVPSRGPSFVREGLQLLRKRTGWKLRETESSSPVRVPALVVPEVDECSGFPRPEDLALLRSELGGEPRVEEGAPAGLHLYVSRRSSPKRRLAGEAVLERALEARGFKTVFAEALSFSEQIGLFESASVVVGLHGAGLSNIVWCRPECRIIELFPPRYVNDCYAWIASLLGLDYRFVRCPDGAASLTADVVTAVYEALDTPR